MFPKIDLFIQIFMGNNVINNNNKFSLSKQNCPNLFFLRVGLSKIQEPPGFSIMSTFPWPGFELVTSRVAGRPCLLSHLTQLFE
jgi:hypothetical protein